MAILFFRNRTLTVPDEELRPSAAEMATTDLKAAHFEAWSRLCKRIGTEGTPCTEVGPGDSPGDALLRLWMPPISRYAAGLEPYPSRAPVPEPEVGEEPTFGRVVEVEEPTFGTVPEVEEPTFGTVPEVVAVVEEPTFGEIPEVVEEPTFGAEEPVVAELPPDDAILEEPVFGDGTPDAPSDAAEDVPDPTPASKPKARRGKKR